MKSTLILLEQILAILVFAITAAVCVQLFVGAHLASRANSELNYALLAAQNGAEAYKAAEGDWQLTADLLDHQAKPTVADGKIKVAYDKAWQPCPVADAVYLLELSPLHSDIAGLSRARIAVYQAANPVGKAIYELQVTTREALQ